MNSTSEPTGKLPPGTRLDDRYEVVRLLGEGGMAAVYEVRHVALESRHALKVPLSTLADDPDYRGRFLAEGQIQAQLSHPNIVAVTEIVTRPLPGLVMDLVSGPDLGGYLADRGALPADEAIELMGGVLAGVGAAHARGVVHRDLKPGNVLLARREDGRLFPRVTDFGIAKILENASLSTRKKHTQGPMHLGTYLYMSPEQVQRAPSIDARCDVFALGAILFELVCGRPAFDGASEFEVMRNIVEGEFAFPDLPISAPLEACIRRALAVAPDERFPSCASFAEALAAAAGPGARTAPPLANPWSPPQAATTAPGSAPSWPEHPVTATGYVECPFCAEPIRARAVKCRYCGSELQPGGPASPATAGETPGPPVPSVEAGPKVAHDVAPAMAKGETALPADVGDRPGPRPGLERAHELPGLMLQGLWGQLLKDLIPCCAGCQSYTRVGWLREHFCSSHRLRVQPHHVCRRFGKKGEAAS